jgi:hypothetical protein
MSSYPAEIRCRDQGHTSQRQRARLLDANPAVSLAITFATNDTAWHTLVATWRKNRLELYVDGISRASSTAANTATSDASGRPCQTKLA